MKLPARVRSCRRAYRRSKKPSRPSDRDVRSPSPCRTYRCSTERPNIVDLRLNSRTRTKTAFERWADRFVLSARLTSNRDTAPPRAARLLRELGPRSASSRIAAPIGCCAPCAPPRPDARRGAAPGPLFEISEIRQRLRVPGRVREDLVMERLRLRQAPRSMQRHGLHQGLGAGSFRCHRSRSRAEPREEMAIRHPRQIVGQRQKALKATRGRGGASPRQTIRRDRTAPGSGTDPGSGRLWRWRIPRRPSRVLPFSASSRRFPGDLGLRHVRGKDFLRLRGMACRWRRAVLGVSPVDSQECDSQECRQWRMKACRNATQARQR